jgi:hypothetical protein
MKAAEIYKKLKEPFMDINAKGDSVPVHKWKVQTTKTGAAMCVPYIDSRMVTDRLNSVLGIDGWSNQLIETSESGLICEISVIIEGKEVTKSNIGTFSEYEKEKGQASDALKRAASNLGIGTYLYEIDPVELPVARKGGKTFATTKDGKTLLDTGAKLTSYINEMHPMRMKLSEVYKSLSKKKREKLSDSFKKIWEGMEE